MTKIIADGIEVPLLYAADGDGTAAPILDPLVCTIRDHDKIQTRFDGRKVLEPSINLGDYTFRAVIDWIELGIRTKCPTNFQTVNRRFRELDAASGVHDRPNGEWNHTGDTFRPTISILPGSSTLAGQIGRNPLKRKHLFGGAARPQGVPGRLQ